MMSKIGRKPIIIPEELKVTLNGNVVTAINGAVVNSYIVPDYLKINMNENELLVNLVNDSAAKSQRSMFGTVRQHINNMFIGMTSGFSRELVIQGIGFEIINEEKSIGLRLGFSHTIDWIKKPTLKYKIDGKNRLTISGSDKYTVHQEAASIRELRKHSPYQKFGVRYSDEIIIFKTVDTRRSKNLKVGKNK